ncbi:MAG: hypothetical protein Q9179_004621 [Wetmoreana sp. 5 TL-2023]
MNGLGVHDGMRANGSVHNRVLRVLLRSNLTLLQPLLQDAVRMSFTKEMASGAAMKHGEAVPRVRDDLATAHQLGWIKLQTFAMAKNIVVQVNSTAFFGVGLCEYQDLLRALKFFSRGLIVTQSVVYGLYDLCKYPDYVAALRDELTVQEGRVENLVLMDSFLKESARMCPSDSSTSPRPSQSLK